MSGGLSATSVAALAVAASSAAAAGGAIMQSQAAAGAAKYNGKVATQNAALATQNAEWTAAEGEQNAGIAGLKSQATAGAIKTGQAGNNVDVNSGSAKAVQQSQAESGMLNVSNIRSNAARQTYGYDVQSNSYTGQASLDRSQAGADSTSGVIGATGDVLKGVAGYEQAGTSPGSPSVGGGSEGLELVDPGANSFLSQEGGSTYTEQGMFP